MSEVEAEGIFPASEKTPGQAESRSAYAALVGRVAEEGFAWWDDFLQLRLEGWSWRKAVYIAWAASPTNRRIPVTLASLATGYLGLRSDRTVRKWRQKDPAIDERVEKLKAEPLLRHRADVIDALVRVAQDPDPKAHPDRKMFLEMTGDYRPKQAIEASGPGGGPVETRNVNLSGLSDADLATLAELAGKLGTNPG
jgi:hypothetical protein